MPEKLTASVAADLIGFALTAYLQYEDAAQEVRTCLDAGMEIVNRCHAENRKPTDEEMDMLRDARRSVSHDIARIVGERVSRQPDARPAGLGGGGGAER